MLRLALAAAASAVVGCVELPPEQRLTLDDTSLLRGMKDDKDLESRPFSDAEKEQSKGKLGGVWVQCYRLFQAGQDPMVDMGRLAVQCGKPTGLSPVTPARPADGAQAADAPVDRFAFRARGGHCYRVFAVGAPDVKDLDVAILDAAGHLVATDRSHDRWPVVPARGPLCIERDGVYSIEVGVTQGAGSFVVQVFGDET